MDLAADIEVHILASVDALWQPMRDWKLPRPGLTYQARLEYPTVGVPWRSGAQTENELKARSRTLHELKAAGRVEVWQPRLKSLCVRLADAAEADARRLCGLPRLGWAVVTMRELARYSKANAKTLDKLWCAEVKLNGGEGWGTDDTSGLFAVQQMLAPALCRGWVVSLSDVCGRVYYALTRAGRKAMRADYPTDDEPPGDPEALELYDRHRRSVVAMLGSRTADAGNDIGAIPLPVAHHGCDIGVWYVDGARRGPEPDEAAAGGGPGRR